jgi:hypothetical protein
MDTGLVKLISQFIPKDEFMVGVHLFNGRKKITWAVVGTKCFEQLAKEFVHMDKFIDPYVRKNLPLT